MSVSARPAPHSGRSAIRYGIPPASLGRLLSTLLAAIADFERDLIRDGRKRAMANGIKFGRKRKLSDYQRAEAIRRRDAGETLAAIAKSYGVAISMVSRL